MPKSGDSGMGFLSLLGIMFIGLKLTGYIDWNWVLVLAPIWVPFGIFAILVVGIAASNLAKK